MLVWEQPCSAADFLRQAAARSFVLGMCSEVDVRRADDSGAATLGRDADFTRQVAARLPPRSFAPETCSKTDAPEADSQRFLEQFFQGLPSFMVLVYRKYIPHFKR